MAALPGKTFIEFIRYNNWANRQILKACQKLSEAQLAASTPGAYGTIRETLEHMIRAEAYYVELLTGSRPQPTFNWGDKASITELTAYNLQVADALIHVAEHVNPTKMVRDEWEGEKHHYQAMAIFIQIINHGIEHRTNITTILNQGLQTPPDVDGWAYLEANPDRFDFM